MKSIHIWKINFVTQPLPTKPGISWQANFKDHLFCYMCSWDFKTRSFFNKIPLSLKLRSHWRWTCQSWGARGLQHTSQHEMIHEGVASAKRPMYSVFRNVYSRFRSCFVPRRSSWMKLGMRRRHMVYTFSDVRCHHGQKSQTKNCCRKRLMLWKLCLRVAPARPAQNFNSFTNMYLQFFSGYQIRVALAWWPL